MDIEIRNLADCMEHADWVSERLWREWGSDRTLEFVRYSTRHNTRRDRIPMTFVALDGEEPVGTVSLWTNDLRCRQDLYPWMASLYVAAEKRNAGIGAKLQRHAAETVMKLGYKRLYLYTEHVGYYERFGWIFEELAPKMNGELTRIYRKELTGNNCMLINIKDRLDEAGIRAMIEYAVFPDPAVVENTLNEYRRNDELELFGFEEAGEIIGIIGVKQVDRTIEIKHIAVEPYSRGMGYGRGQILELIELKNPSELIAETDEEAIEFYRNVGFSIHSLGEKYPGVERFSCLYRVHDDE